jgi:uncharacterized protein (TIGR02680 family)
LKERWHLHRAGLLNFWYYDDEEFDFAEGKLLLRGSNGSGKSVTMQSLIPVLLDGKKSPDRLDPFGSRARRMEDYLLGEKEVSELDERTGYLYLEFRRSPNQYLTIGMGLKAKRQSKLDSWGFVILDNRRIGKDFYLYKNEVGAAGKREKIPLSRRELESRLGDGGKIARSQEEYMTLVNRYLFGFKSLEDFNDLVKLLIQVRSPKLSKDFRPTVIFEILNESLPFLSDEELRPLSETIENMDQTKSQLDQIMREEEALKRLLRVYDQYNRKVRLEKAEGLLQSRKWQEDLERKLTAERDAYAQGKEELAELQSEQQNLEQEEKILTEEKEALQSHDVFRAEQERENIKRELQDIKVKRQKKETEWDTKQKKERETRTLIQKKEEEQSKIQHKLTDQLEKMEELADEAGFLNHEVAAWEFTENGEAPFSFALWKKEAKDYEGKLDKALVAFRAEAQAREKFSEADRDLGEAKKNWEEAQYQENKWAEILTDERKKWQESFFGWQEQNAELKLKERDSQLIAGRVWHCPEEQGWETLRQPVEAVREALRSELGQEQLHLEHRLKLIDERIQEVSLSIEEWRQKKDPEPPRHPAAEEARQSLKSAGVPCLPFYAGVEFQQGVEPVVRERLEAALSQAGILDALVVPEKYLLENKNVIQHDRVLHPQPQFMAHTLADYLYATPVPESEITAADIDIILRSILVDDLNEGRIIYENTVVSLEGAYHTGLLVGHAPATEASIYIGRESRRLYRLKEIARLEEIINQLQTEKECLQTDIERIAARLQQLEAEYAQFPSDRSLREAYECLDEARRDVRQAEKEVHRLDQRVKDALLEWERTKAELREETRTLTLNPRREIYEEALVKIKIYREALNQLEIDFNKLSNIVSEIGIHRVNLEELIQDVNEVRGELNTLTSDESLWLKRLAAVEKRLEEMGAEEIRARIAVVLQRLGELPSLIKQSLDKFYKVQNAQTNRENNIRRLTAETQWAASLTTAWYEVFREEEKLQLSFTARTDSAEDSETKDIMNNLSRESVVYETEDIRKDLLKQAQALIRSEAGEVKASQQERDTLQTRLHETMYKEMGNLVEYRLNRQTTGEFPVESLNFVSAGEEAELWLTRRQELIRKASRTQLVMEYDGKKVSPYYVLQKMAGDIALQQQILNDKDRELYEEIIMNSVGRIIRARIERAEHWVEQMNQLMSERDTSSGLKLAIRWQPRTADHEDEMDTQDLVELLKADPRLLKESDMNRITMHFRTKIERAKQILEEKGYGESFHQIIKEMLDYRKWFTFSLRYQMDGVRWKELTDRAFYTFSGGEKAMSMYIPLFSAAYSRYADARPEAPRLISLDEAFAGVDENNIRDMFDLVEKLGFDYIMNSQALWGDYDTVSSLSIVELVRPKNASFVTLIRYWWDGKVRRLVAK